MIFVFGSNLQGRHGKGAAKFAVDNYGAVYGEGRGLQGNSYALPTKETPYKTLTHTEIRENIKEFLSFAEERKDLTFLLTPVGCGFAGVSYKFILYCFPEQIPDNIVLASSWLYHMKRSFK